MCYALSPQFFWGWLQGHLDLGHLDHDWSKCILLPMTSCSTGHSFMAPALQFCATLRCFAPSQSTVSWMKGGGTEIETKT